MLIPPRITTEPKKTIVFVKNFKTFLKKLEELSENFKVFSKGTLQLL